MNNFTTVKMYDSKIVTIIIVLESTKINMICFFVVEWIDGQGETDVQLTVSLSTFGKKEDQQFPDEPNPDDKKEKPRDAIFLDYQLPI